MQRICRLAAGAMRGIAWRNRRLTAGDTVEFVGPKWVGIKRSKVYRLESVFSCEDGTYYVVKGICLEYGDIVPARKTLNN